MIDITNKKVVVLGLGLHGGGVSTVQWLVKHGARVVVTDVRSKKVLAPSVAKLSTLKGITYVFGKHRNKDIIWADYVVVNPGVPNNSEYVRLAHKLGKKVYNEATLFFDRCKAPVIAVTGTRGKSTTAHLIAHMCKQKNSRTILAGNIRTTFLLDIVDRARASDLVVVELSSWQLEGMQAITAAPHISVVTNLLSDHLNRYKNLQEYHNAKKEIWKYQTKEHTLILNNDDPTLRSWTKEASSRVVFFGHKKHTHLGTYMQKEEIRYTTHKKTEKVATLKGATLTGKHNESNILAAITAAKTYGVSNTQIARALKTVPELSGRQETIATYNGIQFVNDTTATTPDAGIAALKRFGKKKKNIILIAGGADKKLEYSTWAQAVRKHVKFVALLSGDASTKQQKALKKFSPMETGFDSVEDALSVTQLYADTGDVVLFSPSAASFNLWNHEFERGEAFERAVAQFGTEYGT